MLLTKVILVLIFSTMISSHIEINIDPEDLDQVSDFFQSLNNNNHAMQPVNQRRRIVPFILKTASGFIKLISIMLTLVGANILSAKFDSIFPSVHLKSEQINNGNNIRNISNACIIDYGCIKNLCWRSCYGNENNHKKKSIISVVFYITIFKRSTISSMRTFRRLLSMLGMHRSLSPINS